MLACAFSATTLGVEGHLIKIEADSSAGTPSLTIIGMPDRALSESRERIRAAIFHSGFLYPAGRLLVNLAPADMRKEGPGFDVPIALALLAIDNQVDRDVLMSTVVVGELALDGGIRPISGILPMAIGIQKLGYTRMIIPSENAEEAGLVTGLELFGAAHLSEAVAILLGHGQAYRYIAKTSESTAASEGDFADVRGQVLAKRALEIAAAGGHHIVLVGPPGCGKSMLARRLPSILPAMSEQEALEVTAVHSASSRSPMRGLMRSRPFRAPHHTISPQALIGGGRTAKPGEASLAHRGVLFLDELPEYTRGTLETMRQPLEDGHVTIGRSAYTFTYPTECTLVVAMNPCPCGMRTAQRSTCRCDDASVARYFAKLSGPLLDRIDLTIHVARVELQELATKAKAESSHDIRLRVEKARVLQAERYGASSLVNARAPAAVIRDDAYIAPDALRLLLKMSDDMQLSARAFDRMLRVARTIADLQGSIQTRADHIAEASLYRLHSAISAR